MAGLAFLQVVSFSARLPSRSPGRCRLLFSPPVPSLCLGFRCRFLVVLARRSFRLPLWGIKASGAYGSWQVPLYSLQLPLSASSLRCYSDRFLVSRGRGLRVCGASADIGATLLILFAAVRSGLFTRSRGSVANLCPAIPFGTFARFGASLVFKRTSVTSPLPRLLFALCPVFLYSL